MNCTATPANAKPVRPAPAGSSRSALGTRTKPANKRKIPAAFIENLLVSVLRVARHKQQQGEDDHGDQRERHVHGDPASPGRAPPLPVGQLGALLHAYLVEVLQVAGEVACTAIAIARIALQRAIQDLL